ncbi:ATP-dependent sacrificial sulfur transferase LarE [uncultured Methanobrevibacter sp.]|uniref:ATP-dependent sacrificial sulfur transferase LarE n=1 Tax=uncultured Methanobrevibacter sp. TaxID=253161 RepID=UPI0025FFFE66|nr:ATP-dependent sacrificial sulfur transferase LarE [uncultured Methanobrevibacter sp.]
MTLENKIEIVKDILKDKKVAIGFSGGADSTLIAYLASKVSSDVLAITIDNHLFPDNFIKHTQNTAQEFNIKHHVIDIDFYEDEEFLKNLPSRCHSCRNLMYDKIKECAIANGFDFICDGNNISDLVIDRPGILITYKMNFNTPLMDAKLTSKEIHEYLNKNNIEYSRSTTCLATRIPTNTQVNRDKIEKINESEKILSDISGCELVKVRDFNEVSICEVNDFSKIINENSFNEINDKLKSIGYKKICLNLSPLDDNEDINLDYENGQFQYQLPFTINLENTKSKLIKKIVFENSEKIELEKISINKNGLIEGHNFKNYDEALFEFMDTLPQIRRNV